MRKNGVWLFLMNCIDFMDILLKKYPNGLFDMIFADPPYFLSNNGITKTIARRCDFSNN
ncbi:MAG: hypothetical protein N2449_05825 [Bacteroidales bacterium]|nr:hypothetical protein [Bacteroidales bacterium]